MLNLQKAMQKNPQLAQRIKQLRVDDDYSWRRIANIISKEFPLLEIKLIYCGHGIYDGKQQDGIDLCNAAMIFFNETVKDGWN